MEDVWLADDLGYHFTPPQPHTSTMRVSSKDKITRRNRERERQNNIYHFIFGMYNVT